MYMVPYPENPKHGPAAVSLSTISKCTPTLLSGSCTHECFLLVATLNNATAAWLVLQRLLLYLYTCQFGVNEDTSTVFANDNLLTCTDIELTLGWNLVKATATSIALNINNGQAIT